MTTNEWLTEDDRKFPFQLGGSMLRVGCFCFMQGKEPVIPEHGACLAQFDDAFAFVVTDDRIWLSDGALCVNGWIAPPKDSSFEPNWSTGNEIAMAMRDAGLPFREIAPNRTTVRFSIGSTAIASALWEALAVKEKLAINETADYITYILRQGPDAAQAEVDRWRALAKLR